MFFLKKSPFGPVLLRAKAFQNGPNLQSVSRFPRLPRLVCHTGPAPRCSPPADFQRRADKPADLGASHCWQGCVVSQRHMVQDCFNWKILEFKGLSDFPKLTIRRLLLASWQRGWWQRGWWQNDCAPQIAAKAGWQLVTLDLCHTCRQH